MKGDRYEIRTGKWGQYFHDTKHKTDMTLKSVLGRPLDFEDYDDEADESCGQCGDQGYTYSCIDGCCVNAEEGCDQCASRCDFCNHDGKKPFQPFDVNGASFGNARTKPWRNGRVVHATRSLCAIGLHIRCRRFQPRQISNAVGPCASLHPQEQPDNAMARLCLDERALRRPQWPGAVAGKVLSARRRHRFGPRPHICALVAAIRPAHGSDLLCRQENKVH